MSDEEYAAVRKTNWNVYAAADAAYVYSIYDAAAAAVCATDETAWEKIYLHISEVT